ncbi:GAF domain-containing protein [Streptomyces sp. NPDC004647]|uniref:helix-turn-helix domain-containing protein n=1 Tax=Streptomyces sp. NPDC004647 TaxID=3154671 RepID=UPI0033B9A46C
MNDEPMDMARLSAMDARQASRVLSGVRAAALSGRRPPVTPRPVIGESWDRTLQYGVDPDRGSHPGLLALDEIEARRRSSPISSVLPTLRQGIVTAAGGARHIMVVTDAEGRMLWRDGSQAVQKQADGLGFELGASWAEEAVGTNAVGTALVARRPVQVHSAEHFVRRHHSWTCAAAPLHDPRDGRLLGVVDVSGPAASLHPATLALVSAVARLAESELRERHLAAIERLRAVAAPMLCRIGGRAVAVDRNGWTAAVTGMPPMNRLVLPRSLSAGQVRIPSFGLCTVEPLPDGWLVRAAEPRPDGGEACAEPSRVVLDLRMPRHWTLSVMGGTGSWTQDLTPRHAELLYVLARHREGRTAAQLALDLFGDSARTVTVRAELSRIRRTLAGVLDHRPYRFADGVGVELLTPADQTGLLPHSTAPAVVAGRSPGTG